MQMCACMFYRRPLTLLNGGEAPEVPHSLGSGSTEGGPAHRLEEQHGRQPVRG